MNFTKQNSNAWIFISHSHRDLEEVRLIRNYLEKHGANPLLFFLKCLNDDDARLPELINDEILSRNWFVLCESENARNSSWVQQEQAIVMNMNNIVKETIDLEQDIESQFYKLNRICKRATVFLSYSRSEDLETAKKIRDCLLKNDYSVWFALEDIKPGIAFNIQLHSAMDEAVSRGFVLVLLSPASLANKWCKSEIEYALQLASKSGKTNIIPVVIAPFEHGKMPQEIADIQWFDLTSGPFDQRVEELITFLKNQAIQ